MRRAARPGDGRLRRGEMELLRFLAPALLVLPLAGCPSLRDQTGGYADDYCNADGPEEQNAVLKELRGELDSRIVPFVNCGE